MNHVRNFKKHKGIYPVRNMVPQSSTREGHGNISNGVNVTVIIPTYNERENISRLIEKILKLPIAVDIIVIDDNSPDGTGQMVKEISRKFSRVHLLTRKGKRGRGRAGIEGFQYALKRDADYIIEMDGDLSHDPKYIPHMLEEAKEFDVVIASRYLSNARDAERSLLRKTISQFARFYIRTILGIRITDPTSGYRCFKRSVLEKIGLSQLKSTGPFIITETLYKCYRKKLEIDEIPIIFKKRESGSTKLNIRILLGYFFNILKLRMLN